MPCDILIRNGLLIDGTGSPGTVADLAVADGRIAAIGRNLAGDATRLIDATGLAVTPGFIDIKTHSDFTPPINPKAQSKGRQGVTTEIIERSEEHTSELQSLRHLVCRLLLEKKKMEQKDKTKTGKTIPAKIDT